MCEGVRKRITLLQPMNDPKKTREKAIKVAEPLLVCHGDCSDTGSYCPMTGRHASLYTWWPRTMLYFSLHSLSTLEMQVANCGAWSTGPVVRDPGWPHPRYLAQLAMWRIILGCYLNKHMR